MELKDKIAKQRKKLGLTLEEVGNAIGVSKVTVMRYEKGEIKNMGRDKIYSLAKVLKVTPAYLMGWEEQGSETQEIAQCVNIISSRPDIRALVLACEDITTEQAKMLKSMVDAFCRI